MKLLGIFYKAEYRKFQLALLGAILTTVVEHFGDNTAVTLVVTLLSALGVYTVPNKKS